MYEISLMEGELFYKSFENLKQISMHDYVRDIECKNMPLTTIGEKLIMRCPI